MASILCPSCHKLISEDAESCIHCGQRKPGLWGATAAARKLGLRIDFSNVIAGLCIGLYVLGLALDVVTRVPLAEPRLGLFRM